MNQMFVDDGVEIRVVKTLLTWVSLSIHRVGIARTADNPRGKLALPGSCAVRRRASKNLHPVTHRPPRAAREMAEAANVRGRDQVRFRRLERLELVDLQLL